MPVRKSQNETPTPVALTPNLQSKAQRALQRAAQGVTVAPNDDGTVDGIDLDELDLQDLEGISASKAASILRSSSGSGMGSSGANVKRSDLTNDDVDDNMFRDEEMTPGDVLDRFFSQVLERQDELEARLTRIEIFIAQLQDAGNASSRDMLAGLSDVPQSDLTREALIAGVSAITAMRKRKKETPAPPYTKDGSHLTVTWKGNTENAPTTLSGSVAEEVRSPVVRPGGFVIRNGRAKLEQPNTVNTEFDDDGLEAQDDVQVEDDY